MAKENKELPPIIDRNIFFGDPEIAGAQLSPDGKYLSFIKPYQGVRNIWVKRTDEPFEAARPVTADKLRPIPGYFWSRDSKYILYIQDKGGNENFNVYALDPKTIDPEGKDVPEARNLTPMDDVRALLFALPKSNPDLLYVGLNDRDPSWHDLYALTISTGERKLIRENTEKVNGWDFDLKDQLRLASRSTDDGGREILRLEDDKLIPCYSCTVEETCFIYRFHKNGRQAYMVTNKGTEVDLTRLVLFDPVSKEVEFVESDPENEVDFGAAYFSKVSDELMATVYIGDKPRIYFVDEQLESDYSFLRKKLPEVEVDFGSSTKDEQLWLIHGTSDVDPGATYLYKRNNQELIFQYRPRPQLPREHLAPMKPVRYPSLDGLEIPAYLTLPQGLEATDLPAVVLIHGGPWARDTWGYDSYAQFLANRGYAVLQPNFRSSTGYGKQFLNAGNGEWGNAMQEDITAGVKYLISKGLADPARIGIMGGSYGGYATLAGLAFTPDLYAAGVSLVGPSNLITLLESLPPYWESGRKMFYKRVGNPTTLKGKKQLREQSPLFSAKKIKSPLLVVQGANDPRVKKAESDQIVIAMRDLGRPVEYLVAPDEGHGFSKPENQLAFIAAAEQFFAKHLEGRYQKDLPDKIEKKLTAMRVDVQTVKFIPTNDKETAKTPLPVPVATPRPGVYRYQNTISLGERQIKMETKQTIIEKDGQWEITNSSDSPMGKMIERGLLKMHSLIPVRWEVVQGPVEIQALYSDEKISGYHSADGQKRAFEKKLQAPVFMDGAGLSLTLSCLDLKPGFEAVFRTFKLQTQKVRPFRLKTSPSEIVTVPAGTFDALKIEIEPLDQGPGRQSSWIVVQEDWRGVIKTVASLPQMGGAIMNMELLEIKV